MSDSSSVPQQPSLLNGWKEIANHLGRGVRTVQRWEKAYGLPVHRLGGASGEVVFAYRYEVEAWLKSSERARAGNGSPIADEAGSPEVGAPVASPVAPPARPAEPATRAEPTVTARPRSVTGDREGAQAASVPRHWSRVFLVAAVAVLIVGLSGLAWLFVLRDGSSATAAAEGQPASSTVEDDTLRVFNAAGQQLWSYRFEGPVADQLYAKPSTGFWSEPVTIEDLDRDGPREVVVRAMSSDRATAAVLRCFEADGTLRWQRRLDDRVRFGDEVYRFPWMVERFRVMPNPDGTQSVWTAFIHNLEFPSVLEQIDARGTVLSRYWSNGYVNSLAAATWKGQPVLLVGAANNEHKGASLAILDRKAPTATAPAVNPKYRCFTCPEAEPLAFVVFPPTPIGRIRGATSAPEHAWVSGDDGVVAQVVEPAEGTPLRFGTVYYTLDADLRPVDLEISRTYQLLHNWWYEAGKLDRPYTQAEEARLTPILKWEAGRFVEMEMVRR